MENIKNAIKLSTIPVFIASLCCSAPIVLVLLGLSTISFAASLTYVLDGQYRWIFTLLGITTLIGSLVFYFRRRGVCTLDQAQKHRNEIINKSLLVIIAAVIIYYLFFNLFLTWVGRILGIWE